jgi:hypothetical protein
VLARAFEFETLLNVLDKRDFVSKAEILQEIKRLRQSALPVLAPVSPEAAFVWFLCHPRSRGSHPLAIRRKER